ncbi:MAG: hypothetical protein QOG73_1159 [Acetobacteraceae bacterium]|jgi:hypothetical protein|nr:hypothetical protein [Acetobacteraceae bacterium]
MQFRWPILATVLVMGVGYAASPYVTLYRLGSAIRSADAATLESLVDWPAVREGIKEDACDLAANADPKTGSTELPPFGASFVHGITVNSIDKAVTPQALVAATAVSDPVTSDPRGADVHVNWAFFSGLTSFTVSLQPPGQASPVKVEMDWRHGEWRVRRVWLPDELLSEAPAKT